MALSRGTRLGPNEIRSLLGAGGMGEVIARDPKLEREVVLKGLPESSFSTHICAPVYSVHHGLSTQVEFAEA